MILSTTIPTTTQTSLGIHWTEPEHLQIVMYAKADDPMDTPHARNARDELAEVEDAISTSYACSVPKGDHVQIQFHGGHDGQRIHP